MYFAALSAGICVMCQQKNLTFAELVRVHGSVVGENQFARKHVSVSVSSWRMRCGTTKCDMPMLFKTVPEGALGKELK